MSVPSLRFSPWSNSRHRRGRKNSHNILLCYINTYIKYNTNTKADGPSFRRPRARKRPSVSITFGRGNLYTIYVTILYSAGWGLLLTVTPSFVGNLYGLAKDIRGDPFKLNRPKVDYPGSCCVAAVESSVWVLCSGIRRVFRFLHFFRAVTLIFYVKYKSNLKLHPIPFLYGSEITRCKEEEPIIFILGFFTLTRYEKVLLYHNGKIVL